MATGSPTARDGRTNPNEEVVPLVVLHPTEKFQSFTPGVCEKRLKPSKTYCNL